MFKELRFRFRFYPFLFPLFCRTLYIHLNKKIPVLSCVQEKGIFDLCLGVNLLQRRLAAVN